MIGLGFPRPGGRGARAPRVRVAHDRCIACGDCLAACPTDALTLLSAAGPLQVEDSLCTACRRCERVCPVRAVVVRGPVRGLPAATAAATPAAATSAAAAPTGAAPTATTTTTPALPVGADRTGFDRRTFLTRAGALGGGVAVGAVAGAAGTAAAQAVTAPGPRLAAVAFHGAHQAGILTPAPPSAIFAVFDLTAEDRATVADLMRAITDVARRITADGALPDPGIGAPPADNGLLGTLPPADGLTVTVGVGGSLFDERYGLAGAGPARLTAMPAFPGDALESGRTGGDLLLQLRAGHPDTTLRALRLIARATRGAMQPRYRIDGFIPPPAPSGTPRNLFGFRQGSSVPAVHDPATAARLLWSGPGEPGWAAGGTYHVLRIIRMLAEPWDRLALTEQEAIIGRTRDSGAPLDGRLESDVPHFAVEPTSTLVPPTAHIRLANPRRADTADSQFLRVGYSYDRGLGADGGLDMGLVFCGYQQDVRRQFEAVQARLDGEPLARYVTPVGGGYFFALPGVRDSSDWYARALLG